MVHLKRPLPNTILQHIKLRVKERQIKYDSLQQLSVWVESNPEVPEGKWCAQFDNFTLAGEGELAKTILLKTAPCEGEKIYPV